MSKDTIKVNMNVYDIPIVVEQLKKLEQENKQLKENYGNVLIANKKLIKEIDDYQNIIIKMKGQNKQLKEDLKRVNEILCNDNLCHIEKLQEIYKILGDKENE